MPPPATVLLVEDDPSLLEGIADLLERGVTQFEITVLRAGNGQEALLVLEQFLPDLIISDVSMPVVDGPELLARVRRNPRWVAVPFVFLTARTAATDSLAARMAGAEMYITKPYNSRHLVSLVESRLARTFRHSEQREQQFVALKGAMLRALQHEFRTPLTYITAYYELLAMAAANTEDSAELQQCLQGILVGSERLTRLTTDLNRALALRTPEGEAALRNRFAPVETLSDILNGVADAFSADVASANLFLERAIPSRLPAVTGDAAALRELFERLLDNAIKFTRFKGEGTVTISAEATPDSVLIRVADTGVGFPGQVQQKLFELFYQHNREQWEQQGSGIGLAIADRIVSLHHGHIETTSRPGEGAIFTVILPVAGPDHAPPPLPQPTQGREATILVVDDDAALLEGVADLLVAADNPYRYHLLTAGSGLQALRILQQVTPDLIISDIRMPGMDGYTFLEEVRRTPALLAVPFIFLTASSAEEEVLRGKLMGVDEYIIKPYQNREVLGVVAARLTRHFAQQEVASEPVEALREQILNSLESALITSLDSVTSRSQQLRGELERIETLDGLQSSLRALEGSTHQLKHLAENFTLLLEFHTGEAHRRWEERHRPISDLARLLEKCAATLESAPLPLPHQGQGACHCRFAPDLPAIIGDNRVLENLFSRALHYTLLHARPALSPLSVTIAATAAPTLLRITFTSPPSALTPEMAAAAARFLQGSETTEVALWEGGSDLALIRQYMQLHGGSADLHQTDSSHTLTLTFPIP
jgi:DNA-binding response OmpR family regulator/anti-sigma regulatory factor (Ser/Thr protein kinase)